MRLREAPVGHCPGKRHYRPSQADHCPGEGDHRQGRVSRGSIRVPMGIAVRQPNDPSPATSPLSTELEFTLARASRIADTFADRPGDHEQKNIGQRADEWSGMASVATDPSPQTEH